ncbi:MAG: hypothetical protein JWN22_961 [Nocardioides sp.]|jgi:hypothetical protein|nr:hypothetical protein [Nocardioides sp.]
MTPVPRPLIPVFLLDVVGIIGVLVAGFAHQRDDDRLMVGGIALTALCALLGALLLVRWALSRRATGPSAPSDPGVVREL